MKGIYINPQKVYDIALRIQKGNKELLDNYSSVSNSVDKLSQVWESPTASKSLPVIEDLRSKYVHRRYETIDAYVSYLKNLVGTGYSETEHDNVSLADKFK